MTPPLEGAAFTYGFNSDFLREVGDYWLNDYDWKASGERRLNAMGEHFITNIDGIDVHFIRARPAEEDAKGREVIPLLIVHGWPGIGLCD